ncbi:MAG: glycosyltransferase [Chloroflexota bacterium]
MRILLLTPSLPYPPHQGGAIRNFGIIRGLREAGHEISLLSFHTNGIDNVASPLVDLCTRLEVVPPPSRSRKDRLRDMLLTRQPDIARRLLSAAFRQRLIAMLDAETYDLVQFEGLEMTPYLDVVRQHQPAAKICYDAHNAEYALQRSIFEVDRKTPGRLAPALYSWAQAQRIYHYERSVCNRVDCVIAVSEEDAEALRPLRENRPVAVVPNGIFAERYLNNTPRLDLGENVLVFTGKMDYRPNVDAILWFVDAVLPLIRASVPDVRLYVVGQKPHQSLEALRDDPGIEVTGWVADVQPFLQAATVYIAPLRMGSGTRLKILEAMASGCAVVATPIAASGLKTGVKASIIMAEGAEAFAREVVALLNDAERRQALGKAAQADARRFYDWSALIPYLLETYKDIGLG